MDQTTKDKIVIVLTKLLSRAPTEDEINNATTDIVVMNKVLLMQLGIS